MKKKITRLKRPNRVARSQNKQQLKVTLPEGREQLMLTLSHGYSLGYIRPDEEHIDFELDALMGAEDVMLLGLPKRTTNLILRVERCNVEVDPIFWSQIATMKGQLVKLSPLQEGLALVKEGPAEQLTQKRRGAVAIVVQAQKLYILGGPGALEAAANPMSDLGERGTR